jgi:hypothetical protein
MRAVTTLILSCVWALGICQPNTQYVAPIPQPIQCYEFPAGTHSLFPSPLEAFCIETNNTQSFQSTQINAYQNKELVAASEIHFRGETAIKPFFGSEVWCRIEPNGGNQMAWFYPNNTPGVARRLEKMEVGIKPNADLLNDINDFLTGNTAGANPLNPYNRHDIDITCSFYVGGQFVKTVDAFWYAEYVTDAATDGWQQDTTSFPFRIRFAPPYAGVGWEARIQIKARGYADAEFGFSFRVIPTANKGYLEVGQDNRHLRYSRTKESWFGVGYNVPWANPSAFAAGNELTTLSKEMEFWSELENLAQAQGNFVRIVSAPWQFDFEQEALGNYDPRQNIAWEFDRVNDFLYSSGIYYMFCMKLHTLFVQDADFTNDDPVLNWEHNPYYGPYAATSQHPGYVLNHITNNIQFFSDPQAIDHYKNYLRYFYSRWGYNTSLGAVQIMSEQSFVSDYFDRKDTSGNVIADNTANRQLIHQWNALMGQYIKSEHSSGLLSVSTGGLYDDALGKEVLVDDQIYNPYFDFTGFHCYSDQPDTIITGGVFRTDNIDRWYETAEQFLTGVGTAQNNQTGSNQYYLSRPFIIDETGSNLTIKIGDNYPLRPNGPWPTDIFGSCSDILWHNALWASAMYGGMSTSLDWYKSAHHDFASANLPGIRSFFSDIDFEQYSYGAYEFVPSAGTGGSGPQGPPIRRHFGLAQRWPTTSALINLTSLNNSNGAEPYVIEDKAEALTQISDDREQAFGWVHNRSVYWYNMRGYYACYNNLVTGNGYDQPYLAPPRDGDINGLPIPITENGQNKAHFFIYGLRGLKRYYIDFYNTRYGTLVHTERDLTTINGKLKVKLPDMTFNNNPDLAYKIYRDYWRESLTDTTQLQPNFPALLHSQSQHDPTIIQDVLTVSEHTNAFIYPNPAVDQFTIQRSVDNLATVNIRDINGKLILTQQVTGFSTNVSVFGLCNGMYMVEIIEANGLIHRSKLIVNK